MRSVSDADTLSFLFLSLKPGKARVQEHVWVVHSSFERKCFVLWPWRMCRSPCNHCTRNFNQLISGEKIKPGISPVPCMWLLHRFMCPFPLMLPNYLFQLLKTLFRSIIRYIIINEIHKIRNDPQNEATRSSSVKSEHSCCSFPHHPWSL